MRMDSSRVSLPSSQAGSDTDAAASLEWRADLARGVRLIAKHASGTVSLTGELLSFEDLLNIAAREIEPPAACGLTARTDQQRIAQLEEALARLLLFRSPEEEILHYAGLCIAASEAIGRELLHEDLCRLSVVFGRGSDLRDAGDRRVNERLKAMIAKAVKP